MPDTVTITRISHPNWKYVRVEQLNVGPTWIIQTVKKEPMVPAIIRIVCAGRDQDEADLAFDDLVKKHKVVESVKVGDEG